jgi:RNA methyltransferase, TrmH family
MIELSSSSNATFKTFLSLQTSKGIKKENMFLLSGEKLIREIPKSIKIIAELVHPQLKSISPHGTKVYLLTKDLFNELDILGTHFNLFVCELPAIEKLTTEDVHRIIASSASDHTSGLICPLGDPGNLGAVVRSAEAFGISKIILSEEATHPFLPKALKSSAGANLRCSFVKGPSLKDICSHQKNLLGLSMQGQSIANFKWPANPWFVVGEEGPGLPASFCGHQLAIPMKSGESLNAVVATSIALYEMTNH